MLFFFLKWKVDTILKTKGLATSKLKIPMLGLVFLILL